MDPNANLEEQRRIYKRILGGHATYDDQVRLAELAEAMDQWLSRGGSKPLSWTPTGRRLEEKKRREPELSLLEEDGFTLIELLMSVSFVGLIITIGVIAYHFITKYW